MSKITNFKNTVIILIDESEIVKKTMEHCLSYFFAKIYHFKNLEEYKNDIQKLQADVIFVDWNIKQNKESIAFSVLKFAKLIPVVLIYKSNMQDEVQKISKDQFSHQIIKPFNPNILRDKLIECIPQIKTTHVYPFLDFPQTMPDKKNHSKKIQQKDPIKIQTFKKEDLKTDNKSENNNTIGLTLNEKTSLSKISEEDVNPQEIAEGIKTDNKSENESRLNKRQTFKISEITKNDLAPVAMKSFIPIKEIDNKDSSQILDNKKIIKVLNTYKDSLEFQKVIEQTILEYVSKNPHINKKESKIQDAVKKETDTYFKQVNMQDVVKKEIKKHLDRHISNIMKTIIEDKIKEIINL